MYRRNTGSNWPRSGAPITSATRGSASLAPGPISSRLGGLIRSTMGMMLEPVPGDVDAPRDPDLLALHVLDEPLERSQAPRPAGQPAVQADRHHAVLLGVQDVEAVFQIGKKIIPAVEA